LGIVDVQILDGLEQPSSQNNPDPQIRACHHLLWGLFHHMDGNSMQSHKHFTQAEHLLQGMIESKGTTIAKNDLYAYALCEISAFFYLLFDMKNTWRYLAMARSFALSKSILVVIDTTEKAFRHNRFFMDVIPGDMSDYYECLDYLRSHGLHYRLIIGLYYSMGISMKLNRLDQTLDAYLEGSNLCRKLDLDTYLSGFQIVQGIWYANHMEWQTALRYYKEAYDMTESRYWQALCLENTASLYERYPNHRKRTKVLLRMLRHCEEHGIIQKVPVACYYLAHYYMEQEKDLVLAKYYYKKGYDSAIKMQDQGIHLFARLAMIVREYPEFMEKHYYFQPGSGDDGSTYRCLEFCLDRDWRSIKYKFQHQLLLFHREQNDNGSAITKQLGLKLSTLHAIKHKLVAAGYEVPDLRFGYARETEIELDPALSSYIQRVADLDWKSANLRFQSDAMKFLFKHNNYNKTKLSKQLKVSYHTTIMLLKSAQVEVT
jgi:tetratricopeptide (TPR) repeat protein